MNTHCQQLDSERFVAHVFRVHVMGVPVLAGFMDVVVFDTGEVAIQAMHRPLDSTYNPNDRRVVRLRHSVAAKNAMRSTPPGPTVENDGVGG